MQVHVTLTEAAVMGWDFECGYKAAMAGKSIVDNAYNDAPAEINWFNWRQGFVHGHYAKQVIAANKEA